VFAMQATTCIQQLSRTFYIHLILLAAFVFAQTLFIFICLGVQMV